MLPDHLLLPLVACCWRRYYEVWQVMRKDYELERRFDALNRKVGVLGGGG
jgi:hypothetical protein